MEDLGLVVNPLGRLDVASYRTAEALAKIVEEKYGLSGVWDNVKPHVNKLVVEHVSGMEIPIEARILLGIIQSNFKKDNPDGL